MKAFSGRRAPLGAALVVVALLVVGTGCNSTYVLRGTFEADSPNSPPTATLDADPPGDNYSYTSSPTVATVPVVKSGTEFVSTGSSLRLELDNIVNTDQTAVFMSKTYDRMNETVIWGYWNGAMISESAGSVLSATFANLSGDPFCSVTYSNGDVSFDGSVVGGYVEGENHLAILKVDAVARTCNFTVLQASGNITTSTVSFPASHLVGNRRQLLFQYSSTPSGTSSYALDLVAISKREPESMP